jgi:hypothetical protein
MFKNTCNLYSLTAGFLTRRPKQIRRVTYNRHNYLIVYFLEPLAQNPRTKMQNPITLIYRTTTAVGVEALVSKSIK